MLSNKVRKGDENLNSASLRQYTSYSEIRPDEPCTSHHQQSDGQISRAISKARRLLKGPGSRTSTKADAGTSTAISLPTLLSDSSSFPSGHNSEWSQLRSQQLPKSSFDATGAVDSSYIRPISRGETEYGASPCLKANYGLRGGINAFGIAGQSIHTACLNGDLPPVTLGENTESGTAARYYHGHVQQKNLGQMKLLSKNSAAGTYQYIPPKGSEYMPPRRREGSGSHHGRNQYSWDRRPTCSDECHLRQDVSMSFMTNSTTTRAPIPPHARKPIFNNKGLPPLPPPSKAIEQQFNQSTPPSSYKDETFLTYNHDGTINTTYKQSSPKIMLPSPSSLPPRDELLARLETAVITRKSSTPISTTGSYDTSPSTLLSNPFIRPASASSHSVYSDQDDSSINEEQRETSEANYRKESVSEYVSESLFRRISCAKTSNLNHQMAVFHPPQTPSNCSTDTSHMSSNKRVIVWEVPVDSQLQHDHNGRLCANSINNDKTQFRIEEQRIQNKELQQPSHTTFQARYEATNNLHTIDGKTYLVKGHEKIPMRLLRPDVVYANHSHSYNCSSVSSKTISESDRYSSNKDPISSLSSVYSNFVMDNVYDAENDEDGGGGGGGTLRETIHYPTPASLTPHSISKNDIHIHMNNVNSSTSHSDGFPREDPGEDVDHIYALYTIEHDQNIDTDQHNEDDDNDDPYNTMAHHSRQLSVINPDTYDDEDEEKEEDHDNYNTTIHNNIHSNTTRRFNHKNIQHDDNGNEEEVEGHDEGTGRVGEQKTSQDEDSIAWTFVGDLQRQNEDLTARVMELEHALRAQQFKQEASERVLLLPPSLSLQTRPLELKACLQLNGFNNGGGGVVRNHVENDSINSPRDAGASNNDRLDEWRWRGLDLED